MTTTPDTPASDETPASTARRALRGLIIALAVLFLAAIAGASIGALIGVNEGSTFSEKAERRAVCSILNQAANNALERASADLQRAKAQLERATSELAVDVSRETSLLAEGLEIIVVAGNDDRPPRFAEVLVELGETRRSIDEATGLVEEREEDVLAAERSVKAATDVLARSDDYTLESIMAINEGAKIRCEAEA